MCYKLKYTFAARFDQAALWLCLNMTTFCCSYPSLSSLLDIKLVECLKRNATPNHRHVDSCGVWQIYVRLR